jgi:hypothetical protein
MAPGISDLRDLPETHSEQHRPFGNINTTNGYHSESSDKKEPLKEVVLILFVVVPAGVIFLYLLVHAIKECLKGCFY